MVAPDRSRRAGAACAQQGTVSSGITGSARRRYSSPRRAAERARARHAGRGHRPGAEAQPFLAGGAHDHPAEPGGGNHRQPAAEPDAAGRRAVPAHFPAEQFQRLVHGQQRAIRRWRRLSLRARQKAAAPPAGGQGPDGRNRSDRGRRCAHADLQRGIAICRGAARAVRAGSRPERPGQLPEDRGHQPGRPTTPDR